MNEFQQLLEQDLARIIIAIAILVVILIIVIIYANISSKRKKAKLDNTRTLHKEEFEKAAKKRLEMTQTVSRDAIAEELAKKESPKKPLEQTMVPRKKAAVDEKTMELNLDSVRRKLVQDEKAKENTGTIAADETLNRIKKIDSDVTAKLDDKVLTSPVVKPDEKVIDIPDFTLEEDKIEIADIKYEEKIDIPDLKFEEEKAEVAKSILEENDTKIDTSLDVIESSVEEPILDFKDMEEPEDLKDVNVFEGNVEDDLNVVESFNIVADSDIQDDNIFVDEGLDFVDLDEFPIDIWDDNFGVKPEEEVEDVWESNDLFLNDVEAETAPVVEGVALAGETLVGDTTLIAEDEMGSVVYDDDEIENESSSLFLEVTSISASEDDLKESIEFVDVEDQSVYVNSFEFGQEYFKDLDVETEFTSIAFKFNEAMEDEEVVLEGQTVFGTFFDVDYTYEIPETATPIFGNKSYEIDLEDEIDVTLTKAVVVDEEVVIADSTKRETVIDEVIVEEVVEEDDSLEDVVLKSRGNGNSLVVQKPQDNDSFVVDITSQLDKLDTYEMNLLDEFDFAEENYNYNFNSINIMEEIVEDMLLDDFVEPSEDEYFKYVYQFALLENMIETKDLDVHVDDVAVNYTIVDGIEGHLSALAKKMKEAVVEEVVEEITEVEAVDEVVHKTFEVDSELLNLTSQVIDRSYEEEKKEDSAYKVKVVRNNIVSPVFGGSIEEDELTDSFFDEEVVQEATKEPIDSFFGEEEVLVEENFEEVTVDTHGDATLESLYEIDTDSEEDISQYYEEAQDYEDKSNTITFDTETIESLYGVDTYEEDEEEVVVDYVDETDTDDLNESPFNLDEYVVEDTEVVEEVIEEIEEIVEEDTSVDSFVNMINEKMEVETKDEVENEEEFLDVLKGLIK